MIKKNLFVIVAMLFIGFISPMFIQAQWPTPNLNTTIVPQPKNPNKVSSLYS